ncbi:lamin-B1.S isoform X6 [Lepeophtheirus salmonis]|uniref:lamin-B1.S isoform X6 n=1 Tax=Lepeophtheirus salmonis TaxID=72036 RepID=UPI003AF40857
MGVLNQFVCDRRYKSTPKMVVSWRPRSITVDRGTRGFGLSLIYRGLDKYEQKDTGIFVARVVKDGQAEKYGVRENDKIVSINAKTPRNVDDAVNVIKSAGNQIKLVVLREEDVPDNDDPNDHSSIASHDWLHGHPISRSGSARSFNTTYGGGNASPSPLPSKSPGPQRTSQSDFLRQQAEYQRQQQQQKQLEEEEEHRRKQMLYEEEELRRKQMHYEEEKRSNRMKEQVREMIDNNELRPKSPGRYIMDQPQYSYHMNNNNTINSETRKSTENITKIVESIPKSSNKYKSTQSLHELGLDNYPNPDMPESSRLTRKEEKMSLQNLNNRLASYIDRVRQLQNENNKLSHQIKTVEEYQSKELCNVKDLYDKQTEELKEALDTMNKQYNQLKVGAEGLLEENQDLKDKLRKKENDYKNSMNHVSSLEDQIRSLTNKLSEEVTERKKIADELQDVLPELDSLRDRLADAKRHLDEEQLKKANLENQCSRLEEDLKFKLQLLEKELMEVKTRKEIEITEMDSKLQDEYEDRLQKALEELREVYDKQMAQSREDFAKLYDNRVRDLQTSLSEERGSNASGVQELKESKTRIETLISKVSDLEGFNLNLNQKISDLSQAMDDIKSTHRAQMNAKDSEIKRLLDELSNQLKEYQNLQDIKVALDMEIAVFRSLIEVEEDRLGLGDDDDVNDDDETGYIHPPPPPQRVISISNLKRYIHSRNLSLTNH